MQPYWTPRKMVEIVTQKTEMLLLQQRTSNNTRFLKECRKMSLNSKTKWMNCPRNIRSFPFYSTHSPSITTLPTTFRHSLSPIPISNSPSFFHVSLLSSVNHQRYQHITVLINPHFFMWILTRNPTLLLKAVTITKTQLNMTREQGYS